MARSFLVSVIFSFTFLLFFCDAQVDHKPKSALIEGILQKVFNLTLASFASIPIKERESMMVKIEEKLNKSAQSLGPKSRKYVALIMEGIRLITAENKWSNKDSIRSKGSDHDKYYKYNIEKKKTNTIVRTTDEEFVIKTAKKIQFIADESLKYATNSDEHEKILSNIQQKIMESAIDKHIKSKKHNEGLPNKDVTQKIIQMIKENAKQSYVDKNDSEKNEARRMEFEFIDNINVNKDAKDHESENTQSRKSNEVQEVNDSKSIEFVFKGLPSKIEPYFKNVTFTSPCHDENERVCLKLRALRTIKCNTKYISVEKLCDGIKDCFDYSDELDCAIQGVDKVRNASRIMSDIDNSLSKQCFASKVNDSFITIQNDILSSVLKKQLKFIEKHATATAAYAYVPHSDSRRIYAEPETVRQTVNEVAAVITTLSSALESTLCSSTFEENARKFNDIDFVLESSTLPPKYCDCNEEYCVGKCPEACEQICFQRYNLGRWQCKSVSNNNTISLDLICDGKLDCYDEADESGCSTVSGFAKFEANKMYDLVLDMISTKAKSIHFKTVRSKLRNLQKLIEKIQKLTTKRKADVLEVKALREDCFLELKAIYDQTRSNAASIVEIFDIYVFLLSINEKLVSAMKRTHIGNDKIIAPDGCFCRNNECAVPRCSQTCIRACIAEPKITRYYCGGSLENNQSIPLEAICNGKYDCPDKDDEEGCSKDICRKHHLFVLRHNLQEAADAEGKSATSIGEALKSWKTKVSATINIMDSSDRPTPYVIRDIVHDTLHDLLMTYAGLPDSKRRNSDNVIGQFYKIAIVVMKTLKSCAK